MSWTPELNSLPITEVVVLVLENNQGDFLLTQRKKNQHLAGYWEFPGGKIEPTETPIEALKRECKEEIDYTVKTAKQILKVNHDYTSIRVELLIFHEVNPNPKVKPAECQSMRWVNINDLTKYKLPEANKPIIQYLRSKLSPPNLN